MHKEVEKYLSFKRKLIAKRIITKVIVQSGKFKRGKIISTASRITKAAVAYTTII